MRILFLTDNFPPEVNAPATRTHFHCAQWVAAGADVTVITGAPNFPTGRVFDGYRNRLFQTEEIDGIRVVRVWTYVAANEGFAKRTLDYLSFAASATVAGIFQDFDVLVATSPQFFTATAGRLVSLLKRKPWVFELRDIWPESIVATGALRADSPIIRVLEWLEMDLYRGADMVVPVTNAFARQLVERGVDPAKMCVVTNGVASEEFASVGSPPARRHRALSIDEPFRVGYLGTMGMAHDLDVALRAARLLADDPVEFVLVGDGADRASLEAALATQPELRVRIEAPVGRERVPETLARMDAALVPLRDSPTFSAVIPSKIFEAAAMGVPILLGVRGESEAIVRRFDAGLAFAPEDAEELAGAVRCLLGDPGLRDRLSAGGRRLAEAYDRHALAARMLEALEGVVERGGR